MYQFICHLYKENLLARWANARFTISQPSGLAGALRAALVDRPIQVLLTEQENRRV